MGFVILTFWLFIFHLFSSHKCSSGNALPIGSEGPDKSSAVAMKSQGVPQVTVNSSNSSQKVWSHQSRMHYEVSQKQHLHPAGLKIDTQSHLLLCSGCTESLCIRKIEETEKLWLKKTQKFFSFKSQYRLHTSC